MEPCLPLRKVSFVGAARDRTPEDLAIVGRGMASAAHGYLLQMGK
jgi:hypothetical protein